MAHLRAALWFHAEEFIARFVTMDTSKDQGAEELGLPTHRPPVVFPNES
jgi:hypothetical protein